MRGIRIVCQEMSPEKARKILPEKKDSQRLEIEK